MGALQIRRSPSSISSSSLVDIVRRFDRQARRNLISLRIAQSQSPRSPIFPFDAPTRSRPPS